MYTVKFPTSPEFSPTVTDYECFKQGCQMAYFPTKNPDLGKFWRVLQWNMLVYNMSISSILWIFGLFYGYLVYVIVIWYIFPVLVCCTGKNLATLASSTTSEIESNTRPSWRQNYCANTV
jgi:hypothetical protein